MPSKRIELEIITSGKSGDEYCDPSCPHFEVFLKFPERYTCKIAPSSQGVEPDKFGRVQRNNSCKYLCGEEFPERYWALSKQ